MSYNPGVVAVAGQGLSQDHLEVLQSCPMPMNLDKAKLSSSAAVIVNEDWALEYPQPIPPRV